MAALASGDLMEVIPLFAPLVASPYFPFWHETHDLAALLVALYVAYRWRPALGIYAILVFLVAHGVYFYQQFPADLPEMFRIVVSTFAALIGIRIIAELRRAVWLVQQREREISALADLNAQVLNERIQFLEDASLKGQRLLRLHQAVHRASRRAPPEEVARDLLGLLQEETGAEYGSFTLVKPDGSLWKRVDNFRGMAPFPIASHPGGLREAVLRSGESHYIPDTLVNPRANPTLVAGGIRSSLGMPIRTEGRLTGILFLHSTRPHAFGKDKEFLESISGVLAGALIRAELYSEVEKAYREWELTCDIIGESVAVIDEERRIVRANQAFARLVGRPPEALVGQRVCPLVHGTEEPIPECPLERAVAEKLRVAT